MLLNETLSLINENIRSLSGYHLDPKETEIKLNQNENPFDWPLEVKDEIARFCVERPWNRYPPFVPTSLRSALADYIGAPDGSVIVGNGSNEMLLVLLLALAGRDTKVIICEPTFTVYKLLVNGVAAKPIVVPLQENLNYDVPAICAASKENPGAVLIICSPNNPTGNALGESDIRSILAVHKGFCILDQAYIEFGGYNAVELLTEYPNLIITRTFSKAFAAAGLRVGYLAGAPSVVAELNKIKLPYNINFFSEHVASVMLKNRALMTDGIELIKRERDALFAFLKTFPFEEVYPSCANFILVRLVKKQALFDFLKDADILIRDVSSYPMLENCLRITVGSTVENSALRLAITRFFDEQKGV